MISTAMHEFRSDIVRWGTPVSFQETFYEMFSWDGTRIE
jgi:hypothetical protein